MKDNVSDEHPSREAGELLNKNEKDLERALKLIALMSNPTRLKIAFLLNTRELCITDLVRILGVEQTLISHYIRDFKELNLTRERREGRKRFYSIEDKKIQDFFSTISVPFI